MRGCTARCLVRMLCLTCGHRTVTVPRFTCSLIWSLARHPRLRILLGRAGCVASLGDWLALLLSRYATMRDIMAELEPALGNTTVLGSVAGEEDPDYVTSLPGAVAASQRGPGQAAQSTACLVSELPDRVTSQFHAADGSVDCDDLLQHVVAALWVLLCDNETNASRFVKRHGVGLLVAVLKLRHTRCLCVCVCVCWKYSRT